MLDADFGDQVRLRLDNGRRASSFMSEGWRTSVLWAALIYNDGEGMGRCTKI